jgi:hypothetical protein
MVLLFYHKMGSNAAIGSYWATVVVETEGPLASHSNDACPAAAGRDEVEAATGAGVLVVESVELPGSTECTNTNIHPTKSSATTPTAAPPAIARR